jgi:hypothetical protein
VSCPTNASEHATKRSPASLEGRPIHPSAWRDSPKSPRCGHNTALWAAKEVLFAPFWPPYSSQIDGRSVLKTPFRTVSEGEFCEVRLAGVRGSLGLRGYRKSRVRQTGWGLASLGSGLYAGCPNSRLQERGCAVSRSIIATVIVVVVLIVVAIVLLQFLR